MRYGTILWIQEKISFIWLLVVMGNLDLISSVKESCLLLKDWNSCQDHIDEIENCISNHFGNRTN